MASKRATGKPKPSALRPTTRPTAGSGSTMKPKPAAANSRDKKVKDFLKQYSAGMR